MTPVQFLEKELKALADKFPFINIKYGFDEIIDTHIVELNPQSEYHNNKELDNAWIPLSIDFMEKFELEEIAFISSDSSLKIEKVLLEYNENYNSSLFSYFAEIQTNFNFNSLGLLPIYTNGIVIADYDLFKENSFNRITGFQTYLKYDHSNNHINMMALDFFAYPIKEIEPIIEITTGNTSHAMAA